MNRQQRRQQKIYRASQRLAWALGQINSCSRAMKRGKMSRAKKLARRTTDTYNHYRRYRGDSVRAVVKLRELGAIAVSPEGQWSQYARFITHSPSR